MEGSPASPPLLSAEGPALESLPLPSPMENVAGADVSAEVNSAHLLCLLESSQLHEEVKSLASFYQEGNQGTERLSGFPEVTQPMWAERGLLSDCEAHFGDN